MDPIDIFDPLAESSQLPYAVGSQLPYEVGTESKKRFDQLRTRLEKAKIAHRKDCEKQDEDAQVIYTLAGRKLAQAIGNALDNDVWTEAMQDVVDSKRSGRIEFPWIATAEWKFWKGGPQIWEAFARIEAIPAFQSADAIPKEHVRDQVCQEASRILSEDMGHVSVQHKGTHWLLDWAGTA